MPLGRIEQMILLLRGEKVVLSSDLAVLYGVEPRALIQAVKRNEERFPADFLFQLTRGELAELKRQIAAENLKSQTVISRLGRWGGARRAPPYAFTEQGVAMLSSVLRSERAVQVNIEIMRAFVRLRQILATHKELARKLEQIERRLGGHDESIHSLAGAIRRLLDPSDRGGKGRIGFTTGRGDG